MNRFVRLFALFAVVMSLVAETAMAAPPGVNTPAFQRVWNREDKPLADGLTARSWTWGPQPISEVKLESFFEGRDGVRAVQYFDKSRMEINNPAADQNSPWYVTNGLLPVELITGRMKTGMDRIEFRGPAQISAIGDPGHFPTYADLLPVYDSGPVNPGDAHRPATGMLNPGGAVTGFGDYAHDPATVLDEHGVARAFINFQHQNGLVYKNGAYAHENVYNPVYVFGYPITGAYWVKTNVGGVEQPVLFQAFERRVLTYNPANPAAYRVEMGNVGQHYYRWRYGN